MQDYSRVPEASQNPIWLNGEMVEWQNATLHIFSHIINYGTGVFEGIRVYETDNGPAIFHLNEHLDRLERSAKTFGITIPYTRKELIEAHKETVRRSGHAHGYLRSQVQFGVSSRLTLAATDAVDTHIIFQPLGQYRATKELKVVISEIERLSPRMGNIEAKVVGYYTNSHYNHQFAHQKGVDEAIMLDVDGNIAEASSANIFYVKHGELFTPKTGHILKGITRKSVLTLAEEEFGINVHEAEVTPGDLAHADEIFLTGTAAEIDPVVELDGKQIGDGIVGEVTRKLTEVYNRATAGTLPGYETWLTYVK